MGLLRTLLIVLLIYFGVKILARLFAPVLLRFVAKKAERQFGQQFGGFQNPTSKQTSRGREGETVIDKMPEKQKSSNNDVGEYVDFEEVD